jgi:hypothetical protein
VQLGNYCAPRPFPGGKPAAACQHAAGSPSTPPGVRASARRTLSTSRGPIRWCSRESKRTGTSRRSRPRRARGHRGDRPCAVGTFAWYMSHRSRTGGFCARAAPPPSPAMTRRCLGADSATPSSSTAAKRARLESLQRPSVLKDFEGASRLHPALAELRAQQAAYPRLVRALKLPLGMEAGASKPKVRHGVRSLKPGSCALGARFRHDHRRYLRWPHPVAPDLPTAKKPGAKEKHESGSTLLPHAGRLHWPCGTRSI